MVLSLCIKIEAVELYSATCIHCTAHIVGQGIYCNVHEQSLQEMLRKATTTTQLEHIPSEGDHT